MRVAVRAKWCLAANILLFLLMCICMWLAAPPGSLFVVGPSETLVIAACVPINTWTRYWVLVVLICIFRSLTVIINDLGMPSLGFSIYDPTQERVYGFSRLELQLLANGMFLVSALGNAVNVLSIISRLDIMLISICSSELASAASIYYLLGKKTQFLPQYDTKEECDRATGSRTCASRVNRRKEADEKEDGGGGTYGTVPRRAPVTQESLHCVSSSLRASLNADADNIRFPLVNC